MELIKLCDLECHYPNGPRLFYEGSFSLQEGERVALLGSNGSGKSTLLKLIAGLLSKRSGTLAVFGADPRVHFLQVRDGVGLMMQHVEDQLIAATVAEDIAFSPRNRGWSELVVERRLRELLAEFGIEALRERSIHDLSGGEQVKVALAGILIVEPRILLLDEPFEGLDASSRQDLIQRILALSKRGIGVLLSTHQVNLVPQFAERALVLAPGGRIFLQGPVMEVLRRFDDLLKLGIGSPVLVELFARLHLPLPRTPEEAYEILRRRLEK